jgi:hypothetical protein
MGALTFTCPHTGKTIETGIETDQYTLTPVRTVSMRIHCAHCGRDHWFPVGEGQLAKAA